MASTILERVQHELDRQHITKAELMHILNLSDADYVGLETGEIPASTFWRIAQTLGCTCDYLGGITDYGYPTKRDDDIIGFTYKRRMEHLIQQLDSSQQWEVFRIVSDYCLNKGITYSRFDAKENRERMMRELLYALSELGEGAGCND